MNFTKLIHICALFVFFSGKSGWIYGFSLERIILLASSSCVFYWMKVIELMNFNKFGDLIPISTARMSGIPPVQAGAGACEERFFGKMSEYIALISFLFRWIINEKQRHLQGESRRSSRSCSYIGFRCIVGVEWKLQEEVLGADSTPCFSVVFLLSFFSIRLKGLMELYFPLLENKYLRTSPKPKQTGWLAAKINTQQQQQQQQLLSVGSSPFLL